jgi:hypothetical protein
MNFQVIRWLNAWAFRPDLSNAYPPRICAQFVRGTSMNKSACLAAAALATALALSLTGLAPLASPIAASAEQVRTH